MKIYTRKGDSGSTGQFMGGRVSKDDYSMSAIGSLDETNCYIGLVRNKIRNMSVIRSKDIIYERIERELVTVQSALFDMGAIVSTNIDWLAKDDNIDQVVPVNNLRDIDVVALEALIDQMDEQLPPLVNFVLPNGNELHCICQIARAVCRRAERDAVSWLQHIKDNYNCDTSKIKDSNLLVYLNRLSDFLFVFSRYVDTDESKWMGRSKHKNPNIQLELFNDQK
ncbi:cob(I)yrinic acid a,c-diamide adenosyltransferase [bacterium]|nr:cob(I)yrinic acid a,c-diamide adenosyltransferase [bacterium]